MPLILLHYCITNTGTIPVRIDVGGDYRGGTRAGCCKVTAAAANGGMGPIADVKPGDVWGKKDRAPADPTLLSDRFP